MAFPTALTNPYPLPIANLNPEVVGNSPAIAMGNYYLSTSTALSMAALNAVINQQQGWVLSQVATNQMLTQAKMTSLVMDKSATAERGLT